MDECFAADLAAHKAWSSGAYEKADVRPFLGAITCPTLIVAGELDFTGAAHALPIVAAMPGADFEVLADCGHIPALDVPQTYQKAVTRFLGALAPW